MSKKHKPLVMTTRDPRPVTPSQSDADLNYEYHRVCPPAAYAVCLRLCCPSVPGDHRGLDETTLNGLSVVVIARELVGSPDAHALAALASRASECMTTPKRGHIHTCQHVAAEGDRIEQAEQAAVIAAMELDFNRGEHDRETTV